MHLGYQRAGGVENFQTTAGRLVAYSLGNAVGTEDDDDVVRHLIQLFDEYRASGTQILDHELVVHHFMAHVDRRTEHFQRAVDDLDGAIDACAEAAGVGEFDMHARRLAIIRGIGPKLLSDPESRSLRAMRAGCKKSSRLKPLLQGRHYYLERLDPDDFHVELQRLAGQRVVEVDGDLLVIECLDHARQLGIGSVVEDHQQPFGKLHAFELAARHDLHVLRVRLAKTLLRLHLHAAFVAGLEAVKRLFETRQQVAVADLEGGRLLVERAVDHIAVFQLEGEVQGHFPVRTDAYVCHCAASFADLSLLNISSASRMAPMVMKVSARLKAGKNQRLCQCTRMKSTTWPSTTRSYRLPSAPPRTMARATASSVSWRLRRLSQTTSTTLTTMAMAAKNQRCQPSASARKLNAAPVL